MKLEKLDQYAKNELSMIEVAHAILNERTNVIDFSELLTLVGEYLEMSDDQLKAEMTRFYTDLNIDGSFISLGDNRWGLRAWYAIDAIDEEIVSSIDDDELRLHRKKAKKFNAFNDDEDAIDYSDDDEEIEEDEVIEEDEIIEVEADEDDDEEDDETAELKAYKSDLSEIGADEDNEDPEVDHLTIIDEADLDDDLEEF
ncbi:DNA-directed RNA polymerase subunit delta [Atopobacter phocae]|uniref:DNA-directed RNA polymerase subunit delta n=1 Tax=Atopobacter phocae TaxID=136492 RepID=UPI0004709F95|nr:DNA-directed RNA polymerase subunit delta [Atopobacter phocae]